MCAEPFLGFLRGTEECRNNTLAAETAFGIEDAICSFSDSVEKPDGSCVFTNSSERLNDTRVEGLLQACANWWLTPPAVRSCGDTCSSVLQSSVDLVGCCYNNFFNSSRAVQELTE